MLSIVYYLITCMRSKRKMSILRSKKAGIEAIGGRCKIIGSSQWVPSFPIIPSTNEIVFACLPTLPVDSKNQFAQAS